MKIDKIVYIIISVSLIARTSTRIHIFTYTYTLKPKKKITVLQKPLIFLKMFVVEATYWWTKIINLIRKGDVNSGILFIPFGCRQLSDH